MAAAMAAAMAVAMAAAMAAANTVVAMMAARAAAAVMEEVVAAAPEQPIELPMPHMPQTTWHLIQSQGRPAGDGHSKDIEVQCSRCLSSIHSAKVLRTTVDRS